MNPSEPTDNGDPRMEATAKPRLARGLNALLGDTSAPPAPDAVVARLPIGKIAPTPTSRASSSTPDELASLTASVKTHGVLQPLVVRAVADGYQLIAGERRLRAATDAGLTEVPVHLVAFNDQQVFEAALVENIQRSDLNPVEKAQGFKAYMEKYKVSQDQLGARLGLRPQHGQQPDRAARTCRKRCRSRCGTGSSRWATRRCSRACSTSTRWCCSPARRS